MKRPANLNLKDKPTAKRNKGVSQNYLDRKKNYEELKELRQVLKEKKNEAVERAQKERKRIENKKKRKEINMLKSGGYEIIKNPMKIKKWKKKARQMLQKLPPEIFYENSK